MRTSSKERILEALFVGFLIFMLESITYKLVSPRIDWLSYSLFWSISWAIGHYCGRTVIAKSKENPADYNIFAMLVFELAIVIFVTLVTAFVSGVLLNLANWNEITFRVGMAFIISLTVNSAFEYFIFQKID